MHRFRRRSLAAVIVLAVLAVLLPGTYASASAPKPTIVLVHGAWADASSWAPVTALLQRDGYTVLSPPNPLRGLAGDAAYLAAFLQQRTTGPVVLAGHSYGGAVITNAALSDPDVEALVYVDAFVPTRATRSSACSAAATRTPSSTSSPRAASPTSTPRPRSSARSSRPTCRRRSRPGSPRASGRSPWPR